MLKQRSLFFLIFCAIAFISAMTPSTPGKRRTLYNSLDPTSIAQHLAFIELYRDTPEGDRALSDLYRLLTDTPSLPTSTLPLPSLSNSLNALVGLLTKDPSSTQILLADSELSLIDTLASRLPNRQLPGFHARSEGDIIALSPHQIDLARGVLLSQIGDSDEAMRAIRSYEASIDLMALQILARLPKNASPQQKIRAINSFIFEEMQFRFPPKSDFEKDIDLYTFLPSVLDSKRGVCLGVSILYLCLAQRLNLDLEIVTPPGHIYVRWRKGEEIINIETTARGVHLPNERYLGIDTPKLRQRNIKETIGMAHVNQASLFLAQQQYDKALMTYQKALPYMPQDRQLSQLIAYSMILKGEEAQGRVWLEQSKILPEQDSSAQESLADDFLQGNVATDGLKAILSNADDTREALLARKEELEAIVQKYPRFREGLFYLAATWLELHRSEKALEILKRYHEVDPNKPAIEFYLAVLHAERFNYNQAWDHLHRAEEIASQRGYYPKDLKKLRHELVERCPE